MPRLSVERLNALAAAALQRAGATPESARITAAALVAAEAQGLGSHGLARVAQYAGHLRRGRVNGNARPSVVRGKAAACLIDADEGLAFPACALAVGEAIERARAAGAAFAGVTRSHHFGAAAWHLGPVAAAGMVGLAFGNSP
ncbi:MAG: Ldh family oxidoreductase, partial [Burkholderiales bacterium]